MAKVKLTREEQPTGTIGMDGEGHELRPGDPIYLDQGSEDVFCQHCAQVFIDRNWAVVA